MKCQDVCFILFVCGITVNMVMPQSIMAKKNNAKATEQQYRFFSSELLKKSKITYRKANEMHLQPTDLVQFSLDQYAISPLLYIKEQKNGEFELSTSIPHQQIATLFEKAVEELEKNNLEEVKKLYEKAYRIDSMYFKTASNLGDAFSFLGEYERAEHYLKKSIKMNSAGYQEYLFLADVYDKTGKNQQALDAITYAFMLNKNNPNLQQCLKKILKKNNLQIDERRLEFPFNIRKTGVRECVVQYTDSNAYKWEPMANCMACWRMEPDLQIKLQSEEMFTYKVKMYRECLLNQGFYFDEMKRRGEPLSYKEERFLNTIKDRYINSIVYWEIIAGEEPHVMYLISDAERMLVVSYIKKYVYSKIE